MGGYRNGQCVGVLGSDIKCKPMRPTPVGLVLFIEKRVNRMSSTMLLQMVSCKRIMIQGILFRRDDRAYKVTEDFGMTLLELEDRDLPIFRQTRVDRLADDTHVIDLTGKKGKLIKIADGGEDVVRREVGGKIISTTPASGRTAADIRAELAVVEAQEDQALLDAEDHDDGNADEMDSLMDANETQEEKVTTKIKKGTKIKTSKKTKKTSDDVIEVD